MIADTVYVIAEAGVNHNGSLEMALKLVDAAKQAGADAVKFQSFKAQQLVSRSAQKADYQKAQTGTAESQYDMLRRLELSEDDHQCLVDHCHNFDIDFISSPFDMQSLVMLVERFDLPLLKLGSGELTNAPLLLAIAHSGKKLILSTGMATLEEVREALAVLAFGYMNRQDSPGEQQFIEAYKSTAGQALLREKVTLLHCTTEYPAPLVDVNLRAMDALKDEFGLAVGYSDHTDGWVISQAAVARGACVIEKHFTLDRKLPGPDHKASLEPAELKQMIDGIRQIETCLGDGEKRLMASEARNRDVVRKSLVTLKTVKKGELFTESNLTVKRPGTGIQPIQYWQWLGQKAERDYEADEVIVE